MDPGATKSASSADSFNEYSGFSSPVGNAASGRASDGGSSQSAAIGPSTVCALIKALEVAADRTATTIAHGTKQNRLQVRARLSEVVNWLNSGLRNRTLESTPVPPVIAREYVSTLKVNFLSELATTPDLNASEVVRTLIKLDEAEEAW